MNILILYFITRVVIMVLESFQKTVDHLSKISEEFKKFSQMVEQVFWFADEKQLDVTKQNLDQEVAHQTKQEVSPLLNQIYEQERQEMVGAIQHYMEHVLSPEQIVTFEAMYLWGGLSADIVFFLKEQEYINHHRKQGNMTPLMTLEKAYAQYDPTGKLHQVMSKIGEFYGSQKGDIKQLTATTQYVQKLMKDTSSIQETDTSKHTEDTSSQKAENASVVEVSPKKQVQTLHQEPTQIEQSTEQLLGNIVMTAKAELWTTEKNGDANKYLQDLGYRNHNAKTTPRCGAFVSWVLKQNNLPVPTNALSSRAFIGETGMGHVGIKVDGKVISGNYGNKVALAHINQPIKWYAIPTTEGLQIINKSVPLEQIPEGAIVVYTRSKKQQHFA